MAELNPVSIAKQILRAIEELGIEGQRSEELILAKANTAGEYDKNLGIAVASLKAEGQPITIIDKIAKERVHSELIKKIVAEETLKAHYSRLSRLEAQLNGLQSINRYLSHTA